MSVRVPEASIVDPIAGRPLRADARANRGALIGAARELYVERGLDVPYEEIARRAGVGRATMYRNFPARDDLLLALLERLVVELESAAARIAPGPEALRHLVRAAVGLHVDSLPLVALLPAADKLPAGTQALRDRIAAAFRDPLQAAQDHGVVRADLGVQDVRVVVSMLSAVVRPTTPEADRRRAMHLADLMLSAEPRA